MQTQKEKKEALAREASEKVATYGTDIDMETFSSETKSHPYQDNLSAFSQIDRVQML